jgi:hypothetical protein
LEGAHLQGQHGEEEKRGWEGKIKGGKRRIEEMKGREGEEREGEVEGKEGKVWWSEREVRRDEAK